MDLLVVSLILTRVLLAQFVVMLTEARGLFLRLGELVLRLGELGLQLGELGLGHRNLLFVHVDTLLEVLLPLLGELKLALSLVQLKLHPSIIVESILILVIVIVLGHHHSIALGRNGPAEVLDHC